jgi:hypothetical protein
MLAIRLFALGLLALGLAATTPAQAANQLYTGSLVYESFGNDLTGGTGASQSFEFNAMPVGYFCNPNVTLTDMGAYAGRAGAPICPYASTPTTMGAWNPRGPFCTPYTVLAGSTAMRPAKGGTALGPMGTRVPPLYRNPNHFFTDGNPRTTECLAQTPVGQKGKPLTGMGLAVTVPGTGTNPAAIAFPAANGAQGMRRTTSGSFSAVFPYIYSYTYATLRNDAASFFKSGGAGDFTLKYQVAKATVARVVGKAGDNQFGGVMKLLGQITNKACYFRNGGCSLGGMDWKYQVIGASAPDIGTGTVITTNNHGYITTNTKYYYQTNLMQSSLVLISASRFPWTTGTVTVTAVGRGPHKTIEQRKGYDNRTAGGKGTIQLVTPLLTRWLLPGTAGGDDFETGGIAVLNLEFVPEPGKWMMLAAGLSSLLVLYRARGR